MTLPLVFRKYPAFRAFSACRCVAFCVAFLFVYSGMPLVNVAAAPAPDSVAQSDTAAKSDFAVSPKNTADLKALEKQIRETVKRVAPSVVAVSGGGSGVVVSEDGYVLTVAHVGMRVGRRVTLTFQDGKRVRGETLGNDRGVDAGMIKITEKGPWPHVPLGESSKLRPGQWCLTLGYPVSFENGKPPAVRIGRILRNRPMMIIADGPIMGGDSGGPLFDLKGNVIGIGSRCDDIITTNIHVPIDQYRDHWDRLVGGEDFDSRKRTVAFLGVGPGSEADADGADVDGFRIARVIPDSVADKAGIKVGDVMVVFGGTKLDDWDALLPLIAKRKPGDKVEIELLRGEETLKVETTLGKRER